jgi:c(7)-type cytochrome triheme protein
LTAAETPQPIAERASDKTFQKFSHAVKEHKQFECAQCHKREGRSLKMDFPGHESCVGCHLNQFTSQDPLMCTICHDDLKSVPPTMLKFPVTFLEGFNMKFDHVKHARGEGRPAQGCAECHDPMGRSRAIPAGFNAHNTCFACHTAESKIGSCAVCHELAPYSRTPQSRYVFKAVFSHADHAGSSCDDCHSPRAGGQGRQVTTIVAQEHNGAGNSCVSCHNGSRAFGGNGPNDFANCARCHTGSGFSLLPK